MIQDNIRIRRRMALTSFVVIIGGILLIFGAIFFGDEGTAARISASTGVLCMLFGCFTGVISVYMGTVAHSDHVDKGIKDESV